MCISLLNVLRKIYNPLALEPGDKVMKCSRELRKQQVAPPRSHWFHAHEVISEASQAGFKEVLATTCTAFVHGRTERRYWRQYRLLHVFRKDQGGP